MVLGEGGYHSNFGIRIRFPTFGFVFDRVLTVLANSSYPLHLTPKVSQRLQVGLPSSHLTRRVLSTVNRNIEIRYEETHLQVIHPVLTFGALLLILLNSPNTESPTFFHIGTLSDYIVGLGETS